MVRLIQYNDTHKSSTKKFILKILNEEFGFSSIKRPDLDNISKVYQKNKSNFWIAVEGSKIIGSVAIKNYGKGRALLKRMYVDRSHRGTGLAKKMLDLALAFAKEERHQELFLGTVEEMIAARRFYSKNGFKRIRKLPDDLPAFGDTIFYKKAL